ncbi:hypothetical protein D3C74_215000 [compost metagenome]
MIRTKIDAELFIQEFKEYAKRYRNYKRYTYYDDRHSFEFYNGDLCATSSDYTQIFLVDDGFYYYDYGTNWCDRESTYLDNPAQFVWRYRKWINRQLREMRNEKW